MSVDDFVTELSGYAERARQPALSPIIEGLRRPIAVRIVGRPGVGGRTVAAALRGGGCAGGGHPAGRGRARHRRNRETRGLPNGRRASTRPLLTVLNKADLLGAAAADRAARVRRLTGAPTVPMSALHAVADLDAAQIAALRVLAADPADLSSVEAFCAGPHVLGAGTRAGLLAALDLSGIAELTSAIRSGEDGPA